MKIVDSRVVGPRLLWILGCLLPVVFWAYQATAYRTELEIKSSDTGIIVRIDDTELAYPLKLGGLRKITLTATPSYFRTGCDRLILTPAQGEQVNLNAPRRFKFSAVRGALTGDWWVDRFEEPETVLIKSCDVAGGFSISGTFTGRRLKDCVVQLSGDIECQVFFRGGALNNDFGIILADGERIAEQLVSKGNRDFLRLVHYALGALFWAGCILLISAAIKRAFPSVQSAASNRFGWGRLALVSLLIGFLFSLWMARSVLDARPHFQDDMGYLLRAKWLLSGSLSLEVPEHSEHFSIPFTFFENSRWISQYTIGWPALLALGQGLGLAWIVGPLCALVLGYFTWRLGTEVGGKASGAIAAVLGVLSPMAQILAGSMLAHTATAMLSALFLWLYITGWKDEKWWWCRLAGAGLALGMAFGMRPLSAISIAIPAAVYGLAEMWRLKLGRRAWTGLISVVFGGCAGAIPQLLDNHYITGSPWLFAYTLCQDVTWSWDHFSDGLFLADHTMAFVPDMAFGWFWPWATGGGITLLGFGLVLIPFLSGQARRVDWLLLAVCISLPIFYMGSNAGTGLHGFGPRYYSDMFFALFILTARGVIVLDGILGGRGVGRRVLVALLIVCAGSVAFTLPKRMAQYRGYNEADDRVEQMLSKAGIKRGLVLLSGPQHIMWVRVARMVPINQRSDLVFAEALEDNRAIVKGYEGWPVYIVSDEGVKPYTENIEADAPSASPTENANLKQ